MLGSCCLLLLAFIWLRIWIASQIDFAGVIDLFVNGTLPKFILKLLPVPLDALASPLGRSAFGFEEMPVVLLAGLWAIARGTDCVSGRVGTGIMEMLLAQPVSRMAIFSSHMLASLAGAATIGVAAWLSTAIGVATSSFAEKPGWWDYAPAAANLAALTMFLLGASAFISSAATSRAQAVGWMIGFYFIQVTFKIVALLSPKYAWLKSWTFLTAYEPTRLTVGIGENAQEYVPLFWQYNGVLLGLGCVGLLLAAASFCHRDVPAPV